MTMFHNEMGFLDLTIFLQNITTLTVELCVYKNQVIPVYNMCST